jgi:hypothetical protein
MEQKIIGRVKPMKTTNINQDEYLEKFRKELEEQLEKKKEQDEAWESLQKYLRSKRGENQD